MSYVSSQMNFINMLQRLMVKKQRRKRLLKFRMVGKILNSKFKCTILKHSKCNY